MNDRNYKILWYSGSNRNGDYTEEEYVDLDSPADEIDDKIIADNWVPKKVKVEVKEEELEGAGSGDGAMEASGEMSARSHVVEEDDKEEDEDGSGGFGMHQLYIVMVHASMHAELLIYYILYFRTWLV